MSNARVRLTRKTNGELKIDIEAPEQECGAAQELILSVLTLLDAAPVDISESSRKPPQPIVQMTRNQTKTGH